MSLTSGAKLGPYEIQSPLGAGGMGEVYRAKDTRLDRTVAIKVLPSHLSSDPELKQRMEREAKAISALQHANICTLYDIGTQDGTGFLVMEYLEGQTLAERLAKGPLPLDQVLKMIQFAVVPWLIPPALPRLAAALTQQTHRQPHSGYGVIKSSEKVPLAFLGLSS
jgi:hypothetical protein